MTTQILAKFENSLQTFCQTFRAMHSTRSKSLNDRVLVSGPVWFSLRPPNCLHCLVTVIVVVVAVFVFAFVEALPLFRFGVSRQITFSVFSDEMRLLGAACMIGHGWVLCEGACGWVSCPLLYAHKNKFQDFIMPMYLSLSMCVQWTVLSWGKSEACNSNCCCFCSAPGHGYWGFGCG